jgi:hypothetical protein
MTDETSMQLNHSSTTMARDTIIMSRSVRAEGIGSNSLIEIRDIGSRETSLKQF